MLSDSVSVAEHTCKFGIDDSLPPNADPVARVPINLHADELNELMAMSSSPW